MDVVQVRTTSAPAVREYLNPIRAIANLWSQRDLTWQLAQRDLSARYKSTNLGWVWAVLTPLVQLAVYTFVFAVVFKSRWGRSENESKGEFALAAFCGMLVYNIFAEVMIRSPTLIISNPNYVKKLVFPLEVFVPMSLITAFVNMLIALSVWLVAWLLLTQAPPHLTVLWLPVVLVPIALTTAGLCWLFASLGVFVRDIGPAVALFVQMLFFATPIFYDVKNVPDSFRTIMHFNPLTHSITDARRVLMWGEQPDFLWLAIAIVASAVIAQLGYAFFMKSKRAFADIL